MRRRLWWRVVLVLLGLGGLLLSACLDRFRSGVSSSVEPGVVPLSGPVPEAPGRLIYTRGTEIWTLTLGTKDLQPLVRFPAETLVLGLAVSPDSRLVAYSLYRRGREPQDLGGADLYVMTATGADQRVVLAHDRPGVILAEPAWSSDGQTLYFTRQTPEGAKRIERLRLGAAGAQVVVSDAWSPTLSADGRWLAYLAPDAERSGEALWVAGTDGANARRVVGEPEFAALATPRFAPTGAQIVFAAVGGPDRPAVRSLWPDLTRWGDSGVALAHGVPWDLWIVSVDGTGLRRLTALAEDTPLPVWSPDGRWIAFSGERGLYLVESSGHPVRRLTDEPALGGLGWLRS